MSEEDIYGLVEESLSVLGAGQGQVYSRCLADVVDDSSARNTAWQFSYLVIRVALGAHILLLSGSSKDDVENNTRSMSTIFKHIDHRVFDIWDTQTVL